MADKILIDTNILLDYLLEREPYFETAKKVVISCVEGNKSQLLPKKEAAQSVFHPE